jgi:hypothetical protein
LWPHFWLRPFFQQQTAESLFEVVDCFERRPLSEIHGQILLLGRQPIVMPAQEGNQSAILRSGRSISFQQARKGWFHCGDHLKPIGDNERLWKCFLTSAR